jgi:hypothetical protein
LGFQQQKASPLSTITTSPLHGGLDVLASNIGINIKIHKLDVPTRKL